MLKCTIELWPMGSEKNKKEIFNCFVANVGEGKDGYDYVYCGESDRSAPFLGKVFSHKRDDGLSILMEKVHGMVNMNATLHHNLTKYDQDVIDHMKKILHSSK